MYQSTNIGTLMGESGTIPAKIILDERQKNYAFRLLCLPDIHPAKAILPSHLKDRDVQDRLNNNFEDKI